MEITRLRQNTIVHDSKGKSHFFGPEHGEMVPDWARNKLVREDLWETVDVDTGPPRRDTFDDITRDQLITILEWMAADYAKSGSKSELLYALKIHLLEGSGVLAPVDA